MNQIWLEKQGNTKKAKNTIKIERLDLSIIT